MFRDVVAVTQVRKDTIIGWASAPPGHRIAMPQPVDPTAVAKYAAAFGKQEQLRSCGFSFLCDLSGKLFRNRRVALKDINGNTQAGAVRTK